MYLTTKEKEIKLSVGGIIINLTLDEMGRGVAGSISSDLHENDAECSDENIEYNCAIDGIESMILGHAMSGIDVEAEAYIQGINTAVESCANNLD